MYFYFFFFSVGDCWIFVGIPGLKFDMLRCDKEFVGDAADAFWLKDVKDV